MAQINPSQGYNNQYPQSGEVAQKQGQPSNAAVSGTPVEEGNGILPEDAVHLRNSQPIPDNKSPRLSLQNYKQSLGQDISFVKETIRNKVAEYGLPAQTKLNVGQDVFGKIEVTGHVKKDMLSQISLDLNNNRHFKAAFERVSVQQPTLNHLDTAERLSKTYGVGNAVVNAIVSEKDEFNTLTDIAHRYSKYKESVAVDISQSQDVNESRYRFTA